MDDHARKLLVHCVLKEELTMRVPVAGGGRRRPSCGTNVKLIFEFMTRSKAVSAKGRVKLRFR